jgi:hypothetical protein
MQKSIPSAAVSISTQEERMGVLKKFIGFFRKLSRAGKIGGAIGFIFGIVTGLEQPTNVIIFAPLFFFLGTGIGTFVNFIIKLTGGKKTHPAGKEQLDKRPK